MQASPMYQEMESRAREEARAWAKEEIGQSIALNMLRKNLPLDTIAEVTGMTIAQLQQLQEGSTD